MIARPPRLRRRDPVEPEFTETKRVDESIDCTNRIVLVDPVVQALRKQRTLPPIQSLDTPFHPNSRNGAYASYCTSHAKWCVSTQPGSATEMPDRASLVRSPSAAQVGADPDK